ncbi:hypothetical protein [Micromonospora sp. NPDC047730]|uniref:hypothetical protein n=1 Tax=Micromonospora sp. NPDC047730 TaxID=3364253 RepID=UPI003720F557
MCEQDIVDAFNKVADNYPGGELYRRLTEASRRAVLEGMATGLTLDDYRKAKEGRGDLREYADVVGIYVRDELREYIDEVLPANALRDILLKLLDLDDRSVSLALGQHYLPDPDDIDAGALV